MLELIERYSLTPEEIETMNQNKNKSFVASINEYINKNGSLSIKQENAFIDLINRTLKHDDILNMPTSKETLAFEVYFRNDYHGDPLQERKLRCLKRHLSEEELNEEITDAHAAQYGNSALVNKWEFGEEIDFPIGLEVNEESFVQWRLEDYSIAIKKLKNNKFRKVSTKNRTIRIIRQLLDPNSELFLSEFDKDFLVGRYRNW